MKICILHLSDLHIANSADPILERAPHIVASCRSVIPGADLYLLAVTGDIAFAGKTEQYELAKKFFSTIEDLLVASGTTVQKVFVPGNHDLDFSSERDTRQPLLESVKGRIESVDLKGATVAEILSVQDNF